MDAALIGPHLVLKSLQNLGKKLGNNGQPIKCGKNRDSAMWQESSQRFLSEEVCGEVGLLFLHPPFVPGVIRRGESLRKWVALSGTTCNQVPH